MLLFDSRSASNRRCQRYFLLRVMRAEMLFILWFSAASYKEKTAKMKFSFSQRYLRWPRGLSISVCISLSLPLKHISQVLLPFLFIIHIYSALTEILIFDGDQLEKCKDGLHTCNSRAALLLITLRNKLREVWNILWVLGEQRKCRMPSGCRTEVDRHKDQNSGRVILCTTPTENHKD